MKTKTFILSCILLVTIFSSAQTKKVGTSNKLSIYKSVTGLFYDTSDCYYTPGKYTPEELKNTEIFTQGSVHASVYWPMFIDQHVAVSNGKFSEELYNQKVREFIINCKLVKGEFWENVRKEFLKKFDYQIEIKKMESGVIKDPSVLKTGLYADYYKEYIEVLNGSDEELMAVWKKKVTEESKYNSDPQRVMREFRVKANEPNWVEHARKSLFSYWYSCMNGLANDGKFYQLDEEAINKAFRKLFVKIDEAEP
jgi:hypothetical protein